MLRFDELPQVKLVRDSHLGVVCLAGEQEKGVVMCFPFHILTNYLPCYSPITNTVAERVLPMAA